MGNLGALLRDVISYLAFLRMALSSFLPAFREEVSVSMECTRKTRKGIGRGFLFVAPKCLATDIIDYRSVAAERGRGCFQSCAW